MYSLFNLVDWFKYLFVYRLPTYILNLSYVSWIVNNFKSIDWCLHPTTHPFDDDTLVDTDEFSDLDIYDYHNYLLVVRSPVKSIVAFIRYLRIANTSFTERSFDQFYNRYSGKIYHERINMLLTSFMLDEQGAYLNDTEVTIKILLYQTTKLEALILVKEEESSEQVYKDDGIALCKCLLDLSLSLITLLRYAANKQRIRYSDIGKSI